MIKKEKNSSQEKRREVRVEAENKILINLPPDAKRTNGEEFYCALTRDISPGGCRILINQIIPIDTVMKIELSLPTVRKVVKTKVKVRWVRNVEDGELFEMGLEFIDLSAESLMALLEYSYQGGRKIGR